jgi:hypothetical protein
MPKTYVNQTNSQRIIEPLLQKDRAKFRGSRVSETENLETNLLKLDLTRIQSQLEAIDISVLNSVTYFSGNIRDVTTLTNLDDGVSYDLADIEFYFDDSELTETVTIDILSKLGTRISRLLGKISRLENG